MSWKTTLCGILGVFAAAITLVAQPLLDGDPSTVPNWGALGVAVTTALGLLLARDNDRSSEDVGIK
jgi:hypothetical protein